MSDQEEHNTDEFGGNLQDPQDQLSYKLAHLQGEFKVGGMSARGRVDGPAALAPFVLVIAAMIAGGIIWASTSNWGAGTAVMAASLVVFLIFVLAPRKEGRG